MSNRDGFTSGFIAGALFGGVVGGMLGTLLASNRAQEALSSDETLSAKNKKRVLAAPSEQSIEAARRGLEDKIAQLNDAIDDVREQLGNVNGRPQTDEAPWEEQMSSDR